MRCKLFFFLILLFVPVIAHSEEPPFLIRIAEDFKYVLTSPMRIDKEDLGYVAGIGMAGAILFWEDEEIHRVMQRNRTKDLDAVFLKTTYLGKGEYDLGILGLIGAAGYFKKDKKLKETAVIGLESFMVAGATTSFFKLAFGRGRPYERENSAVYKPFSLRENYNSFPSGHSTTAFAIATVIAEEYRQSSFIPELSYGLAALAGLSRIYEGAHWSSDVLAGALIGYGVGRSISYLHKMNYPLAFTPMINPRNQDYRIGVMVRF